MIIILEGVLKIHNHKGFEMLEGLVTSSQAHAFFCSLSRAVMCEMCGTKDSIQLIMSRNL